MSNGIHVFAAAREWLRENDPEGFGEQALTCSAAAVRARMGYVYPGGFDAFADAQPEASFEVVLSNGDRAEADSPENAVYAARTIMGEALAEGTYYTRVSASFYADGKLVREGVSLADLTVGVIQ